MDTITRTFPLKLDSTYTPGAILELFHLRDMTFDADERVAVYLESWFCNLNLKSFAPAVIPEFEGDESEQEKMSLFTAAENKSQKVGLQILDRKNNTGDWDEIAEIILVNRGRKDYFDLLQPYLAKNQVRILEKNDALGIKLIDYGNGLLKSGDKIKITLGITITISKKNDVEALQARISALELALDGKLINLPSNTLLGRDVNTGTVEIISQSKFATPADIEQAIIDWVGTAPTNLDTLIELSTALNNDANFASSVTNALALKANIANPVFTGILTSPKFISDETGRFENSSAVFERRLLAFNLYPSSTASQGYRYQQAGFGLVLEQLTTGQIRIKFTPTAGVAGAMASLANSIIIDLNETITLSKGLNVTGGVLSTNGQIQFPATKNLSTDGRILDDYEEGIFTPTIIGLTTAGTGTYTAQSGFFNKVGRIVFFALFVEYTAHTGTGDMRITGLPYMPNFGNVSVNCSWSRNLNFTANNTLMGYITPSTNGIILQQLPTGGGAQAGVPMDTAAGIMVSGFYFTAN